MGEKISSRCGLARQLEKPRIAAALSARCGRTVCDGETRWIGINDCSTSQLDFAFRLGLNGAADPGVVRFASEGSDA